MNITIISGSPRKASVTKRLALFLQQDASKIIDSSGEYH